ncbi:MAG: integration host factor subunit alpha [Alphaproteobacteria bacterium]|nr:integration host factor subunit alpha [Alphaproteobacteria bacterium]
MKTVTKVNITEAIYEEIGLSRKDSGDVLDMIIEEIRSELIAGNDVKISSFGTFALREKKARMGRNPKTGEEAEITPRTVISFKPSQILRQAVNKKGKK